MDPHDGSSLLEIGIDNLLASLGWAIVKSAENAGSDKIHASGTVIQGSEIDPVSSLTNPLKGINPIFVLQVRR